MLFHASDKTDFRILLGGDGDETTQNPGKNEVSSPKALENGGFVAKPEWIEVLEKVRRSGGRVLFVEGQIRIEAPPRTLTVEDQEILAEYRDDIAERLSIEWTADAGPAEISEGLDQAVGWFGRAGIEGRGFAPWTPPPGFEFAEPIHCDACGGLSFELWQSLAGTWRCVRHDPPHQAERLRAAAERIRRQSHRRTRRRTA